MTTDRPHPGTSKAPSPVQRCGRFGIFLALALLSTSCASGPVPKEPTVSPKAWLDTASMAPRPASPAARDALAEGLRWIRVDAPQTHIQSASPSPQESATAAEEEP